ncbi:MAG TPA: hypothetical protein DD668_08680 [Alphaproteobacteria bacterium]|nr:hypothetical protein [Alphaproteobacteria bacterium]
MRRHEMPLFHNSPQSHIIRLIGRVKSRQVNHRSPVGSAAICESQSVLGMRGTERYNIHVSI